MGGVHLLGEAAGIADTNQVFAFVVVFVVDLWIVALTAQNIFCDKFVEQLLEGLS